MLQVLKSSYVSPWRSIPGIEDRLKSLWEQGLSATEISDMLASEKIYFSRNAIIGKLHRLGLVREKGEGPQFKRGRPAPSERVKSRPEFIRRVRRKRDEQPRLIERARKVSATMNFVCEGFRDLELHALEFDECRWPRGGESAASDIRFCGRRVFESASYCAYHFALSTGRVKAAEDAA